MANEIYIEINDVVSDNVEKKIKGIGDTAINSEKSVRLLQKSLEDLDKEALGSLSKVMQETTNSQKALNTSIQAGEKTMGALKNQTITTSQSQELFTEKLKQQRLANEILEERLKRNKIATERYGESAEKASRSLFTLTNIFRALALIRISEETFKIVDAYTLMENRLKLVNDTSTGLKESQRELFDIALRTGAPLQTLTQSYVRYDYALKALGGSQKESLRFTKTLTEQLAISGLTTAEQTSSLLQLSQALNKGKLDGDEFRTIMETLPTVATAIAKEMGVARNELLLLAPQGKITAEVIRNAMASIASETDKAFEQLTPTISRALEIAKTNTIKALGESGVVGLISGEFSNGIIGLSNNLDVLGIALTGVSVIMLQRFLPAVTTASSALLANPFGLTIAGIAATYLLIKKLAFDTSELDAQTERDNAKADEFEKKRDARIRGINLETDATIKLKQNYAEYLILLANTEEAVKRGRITPESQKVILNEDPIQKIKNASNELINFKPKFILTDNDRLAKEIKDTNDKYDTAIYNHERFADKLTVDTIKLQTEIFNLQQTYNDREQDFLSQGFVKGKDEELANYDFEANEKLINSKKKQVETNKVLINEEISDIDRLIASRKKATDLLVREKIETEKVRIIDDIRKSTEQYGNTVVAVNELLKEKKITQYEYNQELLKTELYQKNLAQQERAYANSGITDLAIKYNALKKFDEDIAELQNRRNKKAFGGGLEATSDFDRAIAAQFESRNLQRDKLEKELQRRTTGGVDSIERITEEHNAIVADLLAFQEIELKTVEKSESAKQAVREKYNNLRKNEEFRTNEEIRKLQGQLTAQLLSDTSSAFDALSDLARQREGDSSRSAKVLFAISKALALGEAIVATAVAVANANKEQNLALKATMIASAYAVGTAQIATIVGSSIGKFRDGGYFRGSGTGTSDSNLAYISDREFIVNADSTAKHRGLLEAINNRSSSTSSINNTYFNGGQKSNVVVNNFTNSKIEVDEDQNGNIEVRVIEAVDSYLAKNLSQGGGSSKSAKLIHDLKNRPY